MKSHRLLDLLLAGLLALSPVLSPAADDPDEGKQEDPVTGFEKPYAGEREALGYDPEGIEYKQNRIEDFQVILVSSAPFAAIFSYGTAALVSKASRGTFKVDGSYSKAFLIGTAVGAATIATVSVMGPKYDPAPNACLPPAPRTMARGGWGLELARLVF